MDNRTNSPVCERSSDLMTFLYNEMDASETREFESHLQSCSNCRDEAVAFGEVHESIAAWRDEVLTGLVPSAATPTRRSAVAAFRQFFDLSPLWLKGAAAFAVLAFFVLSGLLFINFRKEPVRTEVGYTQQDVDRLIKEALVKQQTTPVEKVPETVVAVNPQPQRRPVTRQTSINRRPLSRSEREQLAADLRLLFTNDELDLLGDRIDQ